MNYSKKGLRKLLELIIDDKVVRPALTHKVRLDLNNKQATYFLQACGIARFAYNWALAKWAQEDAWTTYDSGVVKPSEGSLRKELNKMKREQFPWMGEHG